jgi:integrase/recombinase XerD
MPAGGALAQRSETAVDRLSEPDQVAGAWLLGYSGHTRAAYRRDLAAWAAWLGARGLHPWQAQRVHVEAYARELEDGGLARSTVARRLSALAGFYRYALDEDLIERSPLAHIRRPRVDDESPTLGLDRDELASLLEHAEGTDDRGFALCCLLGLNGLRVSEALRIDVDHIGTSRGHHTVTVTRKGGKLATVPLAPRTAAAVAGYLGERDSGPLFLTSTGQRLDRRGAARLVARLARDAGIAKTISPHSLRHSFVTLALDAGAALRDVQDAAGHADPRTTRRYDRARQSLDRNPTYAVAAHIAS